MLFKPFANVILGKIYGLCTKKSNHGLFELYAIVGGGTRRTAVFVRGIKSDLMFPYFDVI